MTDIQVISITIVVVVLIVCSTIMTLAKLKAEANPLRKLFNGSNIKNDKDKEGK